MKPIYWILILIVVVVIALVVIKKRSQAKAPQTTNGTIKDLSGFDPIAVRNALNQCELTYNTDLEVNNCAYQKLTGGV